MVRLGEEGDRPAGSILLIRDISPWRKAEEELVRRTEELEVANQQLALISAITRHDISNQLVVIDGYLDLLLEEGMPAEQTRSVEQILEATDRVREMVTFMRDYQAIGTSAPVWTDLRSLPGRAAAEVTLRGVQINNLLPAIEVLADPLIEKVLATLFENAIRHGKTVTQILLSATTDQAGLTIVCEDDGVGVKEDKKERIFERGYGSNTGLGLFLAREILAITGMTIAETGITGVGARFEIQVPPGRYRTLYPAKEDRKEGPDPVPASGAGSEGQDTPA
jgi:signal transduction histidine kinase